MWDRMGLGQGGLSAEPVQWDYKAVKSLLQDKEQEGKTIIMIVKTLGSQMGSPAAALRRRRGEGGRRRVEREVECKRGRRWS